MTDTTNTNLETLRLNAEKLLDKAQEALFDDSVCDEDALSYIDEAIANLNTMITTRDEAQAK